MSHKVFAESECDRCGEIERGQYTQTQDGLVVLPRGWTVVRLGSAATRHLCARCTPQLREWLRMGPEVP